MINFYWKIDMFRDSPSDCFHPRSVSVIKRSITIEPGRIKCIHIYYECSPMETIPKRKTIKINNNHTSISDVKSSEHPRPWTIHKQKFSSFGVETEKYRFDSAKDCMHVVDGEHAQGKANSLRVVASTCSNSSGMIML